MCASGWFVSARRQRRQSLLMTTETITLDRTSEALKGVRSSIRRQYNSAWPEAARPRLAGSPEFVNQQLFDYSGLSPDTHHTEYKTKIHRDDLEDFENWWRDL